MRTIIFLISMLAFIQSAQAVFTSSSYEVGLLEVRGEVIYIGQASNSSGGPVDYDPPMSPQGCAGANPRWVVIDGSQSYSSRLYSTLIIAMSSGIAVKYEFNGCKWGYSNVVALQLLP